MAQSLSPSSTPPTSICSHSWIDPTEGPIACAPYSPVIGSRRREMKEDHAYRCQNCGATLIAHASNR